MSRHCRLKSVPLKYVILWTGNFGWIPKRLVHSGNGLFEFQYECANCEAKETVSEIAERRNGT
jgi:hypothetical protein